MSEARVGSAIVLGLSAENVRRLQAGEPIFIDLREAGAARVFGPGALGVAIVYGENEAVILEQTLDAIGAAEKIKDSDA